MKDTWRGEELVRELCHPRPDQPSPLATLSVVRVNGTTGKVK
jgi:hypothetical protein